MRHRLAILDTGRHQVLPIKGLHRLQRRCFFGPRSTEQLFPLGYAAWLVLKLVQSCLATRLGQVGWWNGWKGWVVECLVAAAGAAWPPGELELELERDQLELPGARPVVGGTTHWSQA